MLLALGACTSIDTQQEYLSVDVTEGYAIFDDPVEGSHFGATILVSGPVAASTPTAVAWFAHQYEPIANDIPMTAGDQTWSDGGRIYAFNNAPPAELHAWCDQVVVIEVQLTGTMADGHVEGSGGSTATVVSCN
jgi:hypothetical protein